MEPTVDALATLNWGKRAWLVFVLTMPLAAQTFTMLHSFDGTNGKHPMAALVQATDGNLYGTASAGGATSVATPSGTAFRISPSGVFKAIHTFCSQLSSVGECLDGADPMDPLLQAPNGDLYGTTTGGGDNGNCDFEPGGCGIVFKMTLSGTVTAIYNFCPDGSDGQNCTDRENPFSGVIQAVNNDSTGQQTLAGSTTIARVLIAVARSSKSPRVAR